MHNIKYCDITLLGITYSTVIKRNCAVTRNCLFDYKLLEDLAIATRGFKKLIEGGFMDI